jgi:hypothetical protein
MSHCQCYANLCQKAIRCQDYKKPVVSSPWMTTKKTGGTKLADDLRFPLWCTICRYIERIHSCCAPTGHLFHDGRWFLRNVGFQTAKQTTCQSHHSTSVGSYHACALNAYQVYLFHLQRLRNRKLVHFRRDISTSSYDDEGCEVCFSKLSNTFNRNQYWYYASLDSSILT